VNDKKFQALPHRKSMVDDAGSGTPSCARSCRANSSSGKVGSGGGRAWVSEASIVSREPCG
jgi:hypothetical protein